MNNRIIKDSVVLLVITLISGLLLGLVFGITEKPIAAANAKAKEEAYKAVFTDAASFDTENPVDVSKASGILDQAGITGTTIEEAYAALDQDNNIIGYVINVTNSEGYGGDINFSMGIKNDGTVNGYAILDISETAGLGMKSQEPKFKDQFNNKQVDQFEVTKTGASADNQIDAISGATITSKAVTKGVNGGIAFFKSLEGGSAQ